MSELKFDFSVALEQLKAGKCCARSGWNGKGMWVEIQRPDAHSKMTQPYLFLKTADNQLIPWTVSQADLMAIDWQLAVK